MPTITLSKKILEKLIGKKLSDEKLADRISMLGTDLEKIEGDEITVEIFPNRPDMLSEQGFARSLASFIGTKKGIREYKLKKPEKDYKVIIDKSNKNIRPYTACAIIKNLKLNDEKIREIIQLQEKLHITFGRNRKKAAIGIYPLEHIRLPITFKAEFPKKIKFQPLEWKTELNGNEILEIHPTGKEYAPLLKGLDKYPVFIDANKNILSMPPVINSHLTGKITEKTKEVFIECSGFDLNVLEQCLNILVTSFYEMGGQVYQMNLEYGNKKIVTPNLTPVKKRVSLSYFNKIIGMNFSEKQIKDLLERMGYGYKDKNVFIPAYRTDVLHEMDIAEDIAIAYGYENFIAEIPRVSTIGQENSFEIFKDKVANILVGLNMIETISYHLTNKEWHNKKMNFDAEVIELENALNGDYSVLRSWIAPNLLKIFSESTNKEYPQNIFETGTIFKKDDSTETKISENERIAAAICFSEAGFTKIKQIFDALMNALNIKYESKATKHSSFIEGRVARLSNKGKDIAYMGEIKPEVLDNFGIEMPVALFELNLSELFSIIKKE